MANQSRKISSSETSNFKQDGFSGQLYVENKDHAGYNALLVTVNGRHPKKRMVDTTRNYFVVEGEGTFTLDGVPHDVVPGDLLVITPGHEYEYEGTMKLFEFNVSPENSFKDEVLE